MCKTSGTFMRISCCVGISAFLCNQSTINFGAATGNLPKKEATKRRTDRCCETYVLRKKTLYFQQAVLTGRIRVLL